LFVFAMNRSVAPRRRLLLAFSATAAAAHRVAVAQQAPPSFDAQALVGIWGGELAHRGDRTPVFFSFARGEDGVLRARVSVPVMHLYEVPLGPATASGDTVRFATITLQYRREQDDLGGTLPDDVIPVYRMAVRLTRRTAVERSPRPDPDAPVRAPAWTADLGAAVWADMAAAPGVVYAGTDDGRLFALDAATRTPRWIYRAGGPLRSPPVVAGERLFVTSDDGVLHCLRRGDARPTWQVRVNVARAERLPPGDPKSRYDLRGAAVAVAGGTIFAGTHEGRVLALDAADGHARWSFAAGERILAAPFLAGGRVFVGCYDGKVHALDAASGTRAWTFDARAPVTSTPVVTDGVVIVGSRAYDLWGLDAATGRVRWNRYVWFSWIESTPVVRGRVAYVGSSDAARLLAFEVDTGRPVWETDVFGWAWGSPLLLGSRLVVGTRGAVGSDRHRPGVLGLDRASGRIVWRHPVQAGETKGSFGFLGSAVACDGRAVIAGLDGRVYAFDAG
jgi:outer membrane protein assembly factor BamB